MARDSRYDILFEPVQIGPKVAKNRFYQPPHCNGMGGARLQAHARMRGVKAEGGWSVINTEHCSVHPTSDIMPEVVHQLWDDSDIPGLALMCDQVHEHGALAGVQLAYAAYYNANRLTREVPMGPVARPVSVYDPVQVRAMDKGDIRDLLGWWGAAAKRARTAGFDVINVDANFSTIAFQFLSPRNRRTDEYGGTLENRARLLKELIEVTREAVKGECAVTVRVIIDEMMGHAGLQSHEDGRAMIAHLAEEADLWDLVCGTWADDSPTSRFAGENTHEAHWDFVKSVTTKPVVAVGRFTSPDTMASLVRRGVLDMVGATRPSIADPFLPRKIEEGRIDDIRECIGCNICVSGHLAMTHTRCTQNPTFGEEWRRGWHPEEIQLRGSDAAVLVVGAGPSGLEAARALGQRGYAVMLAEAGTELGGRVARESRLPGLAEWGRVRDWRVGQINRMANVQVYLDSAMTAEQVREVGAAHVAIATGARWRHDGAGRAQVDPVPGWERSGRVLTPDDVMAGRLPEGPALVYDDDHYYMGGLMAEVLRAHGIETVIATPAAEIGAFTAATLELRRIARRLDELGVAMVTHHGLLAIEDGEAVMAHVHTGRERRIAAASVVMVTARLPVDRLYHDLAADPAANEAAGIRTIRRIGDCYAPGAIVHATYSGHRYARELEEEPRPQRREAREIGAH